MTSHQAALLSGLGSATSVPPSLSEPVGPGPAPVALWLAAGLAAAAAGLLPPPRSVPSARRPTRTSASRWLPAAGAGGGIALWRLDGTALALALIAVAAALAAGALVRQAADRRRAEVTAAAVVEACEALVGELRSGQPPACAIDRAAEVWPALGPVAAAGRLDADVPEAMRRLALLPGAGGLRHVAAAWQVSLVSGAGLAATLENVLQTARARRATDHLVGVELASARATARMVAVLPLVGLAAAQGAGTRAVQFLLQTPAGLVCLAGGLALGVGGLWWIERIAGSVARDGS